MRTVTDKNKLVWKVLSYRESSAIKAMAWKRYPNQATVKSGAAIGIMYVMFRNRSHYMYAYYRVPYWQYYRYVTGGIVSLGRYFNFYLHAYKNGGRTRYRYTRIYV
jgi:hypothetical protein